jgi:hypothetical protein
MFPRASQCRVRHRGTLDSPRPLPHIPPRPRRTSGANLGESLKGKSPGGKLPKGKSIVDQSGL